MRAEVWKCPGEDCALKRKDAGLARWKRCPLRGLPSLQGDPPQPDCSQSGRM